MATVVAGVLLAIALLHAYWGIVGMRWHSVVLPEIDGKPAFNPSRLECFSVTLVVAVAILLVVWRGGLISVPVPQVLSTVGAAVVGAVFVVRAVGDFRLIGFFKRVRGTVFATWDTLVFSPFCLVMGLSTLWVAFS